MCISVTRTRAMVSGFMRMLVCAAVLLGVPASASAAECYIYRLTINVHSTRDEVYWSAAGESGPVRDAVHAAAERAYGYSKFDMVLMSTIGADESGCSANNGGYAIARDLGVIR